jgi:nitrite reductase/ring-hydroxylating ferredoxin subunit
MGGAGDRLARRQVLQATLAGAALLAADACEGAPPQAVTGSGGARDAGPHDGGLPEALPADAPPPADVGATGPADAGALDAPPEATFVDGGGACAQASYTRPIAIGSSGIEAQGTSVAFYDDRYLDPVCGGSRILLIHPVTKEGFVALSGVCTHLCCDDTGGEGGPSYLPSYTPPDGGALTDVVYCTCHGAVFSALDGAVVSGPGGDPLATGLEVLPTCQGGGFVFVAIPPRSR